MFDEDQVFYRYKYLPFDEGSLKTLTEGTIKFTCPLMFNDPFDCMPNYIASNAQQIKERRPDIFKDAGALKNLSPAKRLQGKGVMVARLRNGILNRSFSEDVIKNVGVLSLSKCALNILMWSHYAQFHQGFMLEFRIPFKGDTKDVIRMTDLLFPHPVIYQKNRPKIQIPEEQGRDILDRLVLTKSKIWEYEEEERVINNERGSGIHPYSRDEILCSVIAGLKISAPNYAQLDEIVKALAKTNVPNLKLFKASEKVDTYELEVKNHPRLHSNN
jgi:Protein of unknown function (DUF2971)